jgi:transglutaminase-like putative cysteine protease
MGIPLREVSVRPYLKPTYFVDSDHPEIIAHAKRATQRAKGPLEVAAHLFYAVRDGIRYNPYSLTAKKEEFQAHRVLENGEAFCVPKAILLCALARASGIPSALGFADVRNHLTSPRLTEMMGTDVFVFHGYTMLYLNGRWLKVTPTFNIELCLRAGVKPLEFDGQTDAIFHPFDTEGRRHMEYLKDHGMYADFPYDVWIEAMVKAYPFMAYLPQGKPVGNFESEVGKA